MKGRRENRTANLLYLSAALTIVGGLTAFFFTGAGAAQLGKFGEPQVLLLAILGGAVAAVGILMGTGVILWGLFFAEKHSGSQKLYRVPDVRIIARFAISEIGETLFSEDDIDFDNPKTKPLVKLQYSNGEVHEFACHPTVWRQSGEGMTGTAIIQGGWLSAFQHQAPGSP